MSLHIQHKNLIISIRKDISAHIVGSGSTQSRLFDINYNRVYLTDFHNVAL